MTDPTDADITADDQARAAERRDEWWSGEDTAVPETCQCGHSLLAHNDTGHCKGRFFSFDNRAMCECSRYRAEVGDE